MNSSQFILRDSEASDQIKRLQPVAHPYSDVTKRLTTSIILSLLFHAGAFAAIVTLVNDFPAAITPAPTVISAHLVSNSDLGSNNNDSSYNERARKPTETSETVGASEPTDSINKNIDEQNAPNPQPTHTLNQPEKPEPGRVIAQAEASPETTDQGVMIEKKETRFAEHSDTQREIHEVHKPKLLDAATLENNEVDYVAEVRPSEPNLESPSERKLNSPDSTNSSTDRKKLNSSTPVKSEPVQFAKLGEAGINGITRRDAVPAVGNAKPKYPRVAIRKGYEGSVLLYVTVDANGDIKDISIGTGSGYRSLDKAALNAVKRWRFEPALQNGRAVESVTEVPVVFRLINAKKS